MKRDSENERRWRATVRRKVAVGMTQARAGKLVDGEAAFERVRKRIARRRAKR